MVHKSTTHQFRGVAQLVARLLWEQEATGSSPVTPTKNKKMEIDLKNQPYNKFNGVAPEGMILVPVEILEQLKDFDVWKEFKYGGTDWIVSKSVELFETRNQI